jgi:type IV pilus assembly protein PilB
MAHPTAFLSAVQLPEITKDLLDFLAHKSSTGKIPTHAEVEAVLRTTLRKVADGIQAQALYVLMRPANMAQLHIQYVYFAPSLYGLDDSKRKFFKEKIKALEGTTAPLAGDIAERVFREKQTVSMAHPKIPVSHRDRHYLNTSIATFRSAVPMIYGEKIVGCIEAINKCSHGKPAEAFAKDEVYLLRIFANYSARVIQRTMDTDTPFTEREIARWIALLSINDYLELGEHFQPDLTLIHEMDDEQLKRFQILPLAKLSETSLRAAVANPLDNQKFKDFEAATGFRVAEHVVSAPSDIRAVLEKATRTSRVSRTAETLHEEYVTAEASDKLGFNEEEVDENSTPIVKLANQIIEDAHELRASDIHIEPQESKLLVRYRIDGVCRVKLSLPKGVTRPLISRLKIMSQLDITERRLPQDGRIVFSQFNPELDLDLRVATAPMNHGETVVLRILDRARSTLPLEKLGFSSFNLELYQKAILAPYGMILHCGPTGSGKSATLYAALNQINSPEWKIVTAEDPIEYTLPGLNQLQVHKEIGLTFASALRSFLRQDPDIILVGEVRDRETAEIAVEASLTGHLLFSTLHTNDASLAVWRLLEMGIEPFLIASSMVCVCAQRLIRRLCPCKAEETLGSEDLELLKLARDEEPVGKVYRPNGCSACDKLGYRGRTGIHELLMVSDSLRALIAQRTTAEEIKTAAREAGMRTLFEDAMEKVKKGVSSMDEVLTTVWPDDNK